TSSGDRQQRDIATVGHIELQTIAHRGLFQLGLSVGSVGEFEPTWISPKISCQQHPEQSARIDKPIAIVLEMKAASALQLVIREGSRQSQPNLRPQFERRCPNVRLKVVQLR